MSTRLRRASFVLLAAGWLGAAPVHAADYTDLWVVRTELGWGANVVQSDQFLFVTLFIYGADGKPTWYSADLVFDGTRFSGSLYASQGTYWPLVWNPAQSPPAKAVGTASFTPDALNPYQATLVYAVNGVGAVTKAVERLTLTAVPLGGVYLGGQSGGYSGCSASSNNGAYTDTFDLTVAHAAGAATWTFTYGTGATCTMGGTLEQHGQTYRIPAASYQCTGSLAFSTTATMYELKATSLGIEGRFAATLPNGCREDANFAAVLR